MIRITEKDWSFAKINEVDKARVARLQSPGAPENLVESLAQAIDRALDRQEFRIGVDSKRNAFTELRAIVQFRVSPELYDWFFNARTGYRAQFWIDPNVGLDFNREIVGAITKVLRRRLPEMVDACRIKAILKDGSRKEVDAGPMEITRDELLRSLAPDTSKIWICERLISPGKESEEIGFATLCDAVQSPAKLNVPRWAEAANPKTGEMGEGLRAPLPCLENSWLDLKGGFLDANRNPSQIKPQNDRADQIHKYGWT